MRNILEIIKKMPTGRYLYSTIYGTLNFKGIDNLATLYPIIALYTLNDGRKKDEASFTKDGRFRDVPDAACVLFPSKYCQNWDEWQENLVKDGDIVKLKDGKVVKFDYTRINYDDIVRFASEDELTEQKQDEQPTKKAIFVPKAVFAPKAIFEPFDKVLVADRAGDKWKCNFFSHYVADDDELCKFRCVANSCRLCIPFEGNENLVGTKVTEEQVAEINKVYK